MKLSLKIPGESQKLAWLSSFNMQVEVTYYQPSNFILIIADQLNHKLGVTKKN